MPCVGLQQYKEILGSLQNAVHKAHTEWNEQIHTQFIIKWQRCAGARVHYRRRVCEPRAVFNVASNQEADTPAGLAAAVCSCFVLN